MKTTTLLVLLSLGFCYPSAAWAVTFDWAVIGSPDNDADTELMADGTTGYGSVGYNYRISKAEVTYSQYIEFLNAVADTDTNGLYNTLMGSSTWGGIIRSGFSGSYTYAVKPNSIGNGPGGADGDDYTYGDKPVVYVSFFNAMRFANWLENGQPMGAQDASTTEDGVYTISDGLSEIRDPNATYFIPSEDEWYKAAYYDPNSGVYYDYSTSTNSTPNNSLPSADTGNSANFYDGLSSTTGDPLYWMTDVGAYTMSDSPYGTFDQSGNVDEWNEAIIDSSSRGQRGGDGGDHSDGLLSSSRSKDNPLLESASLGFRVASVAIPEPTTTVLALTALLLTFGRRRTQ